MNDDAPPAPSFLRQFTFGHVRQLDALADRMLTGLSARAPLLRTAAEQYVCVDVDDTIVEVHGPQEQLSLKIVFKCADLLADSGLTDAKTLSGLTELTVLYDGDEVFELSKLHSFSVYRAPCKCKPRSDNTSA